MVLDMAIDSVGKDVIIIKDNKVFAKGRSVAMRGREYVSVKLCPEDMEKFFGKMDEEYKKILSSVGHIRFSVFTGGFLELSLDFEGQHEDIVKQFEDTCAVDHFNLRYGIVPEHFKTAEGYRAAFDSEKEE